MTGALFASAILPQLFEGVVLQDVDVTDRQPGLGRDLVNGPTLDPLWAVIRGVSAEHHDLFTTTRHMNPLIR